MVERLVANEKVEGSTPFARSIIFSTIMSKINELNIKELFSNFKETDKKSNNFMNYDDRWEKIESKVDIKKGSIQKKLIETIPGFSISDFLIINHWLNYAKLINDLTYKDISLDFLYSEHISQKISNQIEFRKKEFMC